MSRKKTNGNSVKTLGDVAQKLKARYGIDEFTTYECFAEYQEIVNVNRLSERRVVMDFQRSMIAWFEDGTNGGMHYDEWIAGNWE